MNSGLGSPDLFVYGPLPYYAAALFRIFGLGPARELGISIWVALCLSGLAAYVWLRDVVAGRTAPTVTAVLYMVIPYHLKTDLYTRSALAEFWAFVWMPLILYFMRRLIRERTASALAGLAVSYTFLLATHLFTALLFSPIVLLYAGFYAQEWDGRFKSLTRVGFGLVLGTGLCAAYLLPALAFQKYISPYKLIESRPELYIFDRFFLFSHAMSSDPFIATLSWLTAWTTLVAVGAFAVAYTTKSKGLRRESLFWAAVAAASVSMMLPFSSFVWRMVPQLRAIQFPWRCNTLLALSTTILAGLAVASFLENRGRQKTAVGVCTLVLIVGWAIPAWRSMANQHHWVKENESYSQDYLITAWARWTNPRLLTPPGVQEIAHQGGDANILPDNGSALITKWAPRAIDFHLLSEAQTSVTVKQFYFPGWTAVLASGRGLRLSPSPDGLIRINLPAGYNEVHLSLPRGRVEISGIAISSIAGLLVVLLLGRGLRFSMRA